MRSQYDLPRVISRSGGLVKMKIHDVRAGMLTSTEVSLNAL
jgi:hypothetical protein